MPTPSKVQDLDEVLSWIVQGHTYQWICEEYRHRYGVETTPSMWAAIRRRHGLDRRLVRDPALIPWQVEPEHRHAHAASMLRAEARRRAGRPLSPRVAGSLRAWVDRMAREGTVVFYDRCVGWRYAARREGIDHDLIREPVSPENEPTASGAITVSVVIVYDDGRTVPFDQLLLSPRSQRSLKV